MKEEHKDILKRYFPAAAMPQVVASIDSRCFSLFFKPPRRTKLGDFRPPRNRGDICLITLNQDLHPFQMLITFVHELAHYDVYQKYGSRVQPHGDEWKSAFSSLMRPYLVSAIFPDDVLVQLKQHLCNISASSSADLDLLSVLRSYEPRREGFVTVEEIPMGADFITERGLLLQKGPRLRKRYKCYCKAKNQCYLVNPLLEVLPA